MVERSEKVVCINHGVLGGTYVRSQDITTTTITLSGKPIDRTDNFSSMVF